VQLRDNGKIDDSVLTKARKKLAIKSDKKPPAAV
jgi:Arc/MetJ family transcription regulator